jgi:type IV fimbrial biogenesis protein FimT
MRLLSLHRFRGVSLIEIMVAVALMALLAMLGAPAMAEYMRNSRLREAGGIVRSALLAARAEAVKRNDRVSVLITAEELTLVDTTGTPLRSLVLPPSVSLQAETVLGSNPPLAVASLGFGGAGRTVPFGSFYRINTSHDGVTCDGDGTRCPRVVVRAGGAVTYCSTQEDC